MELVAHNVMISMTNKGVWPDQGVRNRDLRKSAERSDELVREDVDDVISEVCRNVFQEIPANLNE